MTQIQFKMKSKIGTLYLVASQSGLQSVFWKRQKLPTVATLTGNTREMKNLKKAASELSQYLDRKRKRFDIKLDVSGTDFQKKVWKELQKIPYGKTTSYKEIANRLGTKAVRAVGTANAKNPLCIVIPCHRVIASSGSLGGYSGGLNIKKQLLSIEKKV